MLSQKTKCFGKTEIPFGAMIREYENYIMFSYNIIWRVKQGKV
jgi:hypothetical protein